MAFSAICVSAGGVEFLGTVVAYDGSTLRLDRASGFFMADTVPYTGQTICRSRICVMDESRRHVSPADLLAALN